MSIAQVNTVHDIFFHFCFYRYISVETLPYVRFVYNVRRMLSWYMLDKTDCMSVYVDFCDVIYYCFLSQLHNVKVDRDSPLSSIFKC